MRFAIRISLEVENACQKLKPGHSVKLKLKNYQGSQGIISDHEWRAALNEVGKFMARKLPRQKCVLTKDIEMVHDSETPLHISIRKLEKDT